MNGFRHLLLLIKKEKNLCVIIFKTQMKSRFAFLNNPYQFIKM